MKISVEHLGEAPVTISVDEPVESFPLLSEICADKNVSITGRIAGELVVQREFDTVRVAGRFSVPLSMVCSRCLADYPSAVEPVFTLFFKKGTPEHGAQDDEFELSDEDLISSWYAGEEIDLSHEIDEQIAMEIPLKPLCRDNCKGLCHECGADLNNSSCSCVKETVSLAFSALKNFTVTTK